MLNISMIQGSAIFLLISSASPRTAELTKMIERPDRGMVPNRQGGDGSGSPEVGRIVLGARHFIIALAPEFPCYPEPDEICRFEIAGLPLAVFETDRHDRPEASDAVNELADRLTGRELEIAVLVAQGHANKNIAYRLQISEWTVATYLRRVFAKLNVESRAAMVFRCAPLINASLTPAQQTERAGARHRRSHDDA
jgi:DNA-binding CsgD family transcriptional regulator